METIVQFFDKEHFTTEDAISSVNDLINKYESIIGRILKIKKDMPEENECAGFRRHGQKTELLQNLQEILSKLRDQVGNIEERLAGGEVRDFEKRDDPRLNQAILDLLVAAIAACHQAYANQSKSFAVLLQDLERLLLHCQRKAECASDDDSPEQATKRIQQHKEETSNDEMLVYVRVFHRQMPALLEEKSSLMWLKSLLESVKLAEKHGLAVYEREDEVKHSLKNECYAYATLKIARKQNVTDQRQPKVDPRLGAHLLTIEPVELKNLLKLTYSGRDYLIEDGIVRRPKDGRN
jgi:hypothetical protein